jgi:hypothetical protein
MSERSPSSSAARERLDPRVRRLLFWLKDGGAIRCAADGGFRLTDEAAAAAHATGKTLAKGLVEICVAEDLLEWQRGELVLSEAGRARLRREEAATEPFREQHQLRSMAEREIAGTRRPVLVNEAESPLGWLRSRKDRNGRPLISAPQYEAGERLRADYGFAHLSPRVTSNWSLLAPSARTRRAAPANAADLRDEVIAAKERVMRALMAVGPEVSGILVDICCELKGLEEAEKANGWPQRAGKVVLQIALTRLARHYGLIGDDAAGGERRHGVRHWGSEDYRPTLDAWRKD